MLKRSQKPTASSGAPGLCILEALVKMRHVKLHYSAKPISYKMAKCNVRYLLLVLTCFLMFLSCTFYSYKIPAEEERGTRYAKVEFSIYHMPLGYKLQDHFSEYVTDTTKDYFLLEVLFTDSASSSRSIRLSVSSVTIHLREPDLSVTSMLPLLSTKKTGGEWYIDVMPIPLSKKYERDFDVKFKLRIYDDDSGELLEVLPLSVHCKWTRHFYTIFNPPYG